MAKIKTFSPPAGIIEAIGAALLFGISTPLAKVFLGEVQPFLMAGLLYFGAGAGLGLPNIRKNSDLFDIETRVGRGTRIRSTILLGARDEGDARLPQPRCARKVMALLAVRLGDVVQQRGHLHQGPAGLGQAVQVGQVAINPGAQVRDVLGVRAVHVEPLV